MKKQSFTKRALKPCPDSTNFLKILSIDHNYKYNETDVKMLGSEVDEKNKNSD
ncbi:hypothetical protein [Bacillus sp. SM2101]|uniref:hypothetical protein n=1 Tax=Bacillus sp. SM2101 TaxID=2805366 RepID=UPI001BDEA55C|nr:hypothetical protein [Bacillus sp. SM2101]